MMTPRLPRDFPATGMINFGLCALVLVLIGGTSTQYAVLSALSLPACLATMAAHRRKARQRNSATDYLLSYTATALIMLQWCYIAIVALGSFSSTQPILLRSIE
ncbi:hypothetical protein [Rhizobium sp. CNPSo 3490]|uniref:hypothetical protein n=1 Tax=Rhizobium sp. CNPSo 3490 TaxID=3021407 RepID=UPI00255049EF|nr:hypothetical protein [Rhizobium sp. CNPSo 3490]MDK4733628.1 hypothetical protein [Rhizobium sp. CNPSo 3490]